MKRKEKIVAAVVLLLFGISFLAYRGTNVSTSPQDNADRLRAIANQLWEQYGELNEQTIAAVEAANAAQAYADQLQTALDNNFPNDPQAEQQWEDGEAEQVDQAQWAAEQEVEQAAQLAEQLAIVAQQLEHEREESRKAAEWAGSNANWAEKDVAYQRRRFGPEYQDMSLQERLRMNELITEAETLEDEFTERWTAHATLTQGNLREQRERTKHRSRRG